MRDPAAQRCSWVPRHATISLFAKRSLSNASLVDPLALCEETPSKGSRFSSRDLQMATQQVGLRACGIKPLRPRAVQRRSVVLTRAVAEPQVANGNTNGVSAGPSLAGWTPESWKQRVALQVGGTQCDLGSGVVPGALGAAWMPWRCGRRCH